MGRAEPVETPASVAINDKKLAFWEIHFGVKARPAGSEVEVLRDPTKDRAYNLQQFDRLEKEYASAGCLDTERQRRINALRWRVSRGSVGAPLD